MILNDLFENKLSDFVIAYQDYLRIGKSEERARQFKQNWGLSPRDWVRRYWRDIAKLEQLPLPPDHHVMHEADEDLEENLRKWFKEKWVRFNPQGKIMGPCARGSSKEGKPKCLPQAKAHALGKKGRASAAAKKRREDPNPERRGPAKNVATKVKEQGVEEGWFSNFKEKMTKASIRQTFSFAMIIIEKLIEGLKRNKVSSDWVHGGQYGHTEGQVLSEAVEMTKNTELIQLLDEFFFNLSHWNIKHPDINLTKTLISQLVSLKQGLTPYNNRVQQNETLEEKQDACYHKVKSRYKVWPSAYASGALVQCRKKGAANWGTGGKKKK